MDVTIEGEVVEWRGPAPYHFVRVPDAEAEAIAELRAIVSYGWGVIPVQGSVGATTFSTSLFPRDGGYLVPLKTAVREAERIALGDRIVLRLRIG